MCNNTVAPSLIYIADLEFITAQSPYGMRGMLIGLFYCVRGLFGLITGLIMLSFSLGYEHHPWHADISCGLPLHTVTLFIEVAGLVLFVAVAAKYKRRERDENFHGQFIVEEHYGAMVSHPLYHEEI